jgi:hypothetical protein
MESFITSLLDIMSKTPGFQFMGIPIEGRIPRSLYFISHDVDFVLYSCYSGDDYQTLVIGNSKLSFRDWGECDFVSQDSHKHFAKILLVFFHSSFLKTLFHSSAFF